tara:strand:+ start:1321 stop:2397 length:1077 start_codon:yes stop_codon:yes gene_type:complete
MADVANYTIENNSGANVRIDLNNVFSAIQSSNSKSTDLISSQCVAGMPFLNTTSNVLKIRNSNNTSFTDIGNIDQANLGLLPATGGTMTGVLQCATGAANAPSLHFGSSNTGFYQDATNIIGFGGSGNLSFKFSNSGIDFIGARPARFFDSDSTHYVALQSTGTVTSNRTITLPNESGTVLTSSSTIPTSQLSGGSVTIGSTSINLGAAATTITGLSELTVTTLNATNQNINNIKNAGGANESTADQIYEGRAKIWVNFNGTNTTIRDDFGVTSVGDHGVGIYQLNFDTNFSSTDYCPTGFVHRNGSTGGRVLCHIDTFNQINVGSYRFMVSGTNNGSNVGLSVVDVTHAFVAIHGDQ